MTIKEELIDYANRCLAGEEISGKKHKWACMRFLRDCKKEDAKNVQANVWPYHWDEEEASKTGFLCYSILKVTLQDSRSA